MNRRNYLQTLSALFAVSALGCTPTRKESASQTPEAEAVLPQGMTFELPDLPEEAKNFYLVSDLGRNGYYEQKTIAELMGKMAEQVDIEFVVAAGDTHHFEGVASIDDPLWMTNYELVYSHPELMLEWFAVNGNHEYRGNTQAVLDYSKKSRRWIAPARYYDGRICVTAWNRFWINTGWICIYVVIFIISSIFNRPGVKWIIW